MPTEAIQNPNRKWLWNADCVHKITKRVRRGNIIIATSANRYTGLESANGVPCEDSVIVSLTFATGAYRDS